MKRLILSSPAKLNLALRVVNKRPDGYHNLKTLFERINLCDDIHIVSRNDGKIRIICSHPHVPQGIKNFVYRAAKLMQDDNNVSRGADITIVKRIPVAAGLAGGSSNAATALLGLNNVWNLGLTKDKLLQYGRKIGSDVPFFLYDYSWGLGTRCGDYVKEVPISTKIWHILVIPRIKMYSREVFTRFKMQLTKTTDNVNILIRSLRNNNIKRVEKMLFNDLESTILKICPRLLNAKERLKAFNLKGVAFSGSGPAVFGLTKSKQQAEGFKKVLDKIYSQVYIVRIL